MEKRWLVTVALLVLVTCGAAVVAAAAPPWWSSDAQQLEMARAIPGFGGASLGPDGRPVVYLRDPATQQGSLEKTIGRGALVLRGDYDFADLVDWRFALRPLLGMPGVTLLDADERANRVALGVDPAATAAQRAAIQEAIARAGVPAAAVQLVDRVAMAELPLVVPASALADKKAPRSVSVRSRFRPMPGGVQILFKNSDPRYYYICTASFVAYLGGRAGFVTNRHCTDVEGAVDGTSYMQGPEPPNGRDAVAKEISDPAFFTGDGCPTNKQCRYSDSAFAAFTNSRFGSLGKLARIAAAGNGSLTLSPSTARWQLTDRYDGVLVGDQLSKVGRTTGWTQGDVQSTCADVTVQGGNIENLCQDIVAADIDHGDSGSPVFVAGSGNNARLAGVLWGGGTVGGQSVFVFSPLGAVEDELGALRFH